MSLLCEWQQLDIFEVVHEVASDLVYLAVDDLNLCVLLTLGQHVQVDSEGWFDLWKLGIDQIVLICPLLLLLMPQQFDHLRHRLYLHV